MITSEEVLETIKGTTEDPWTLTYSGAEVRLLDPKTDQIRLIDLAYHLSNLSRYTGAAYRQNGNVYTVAQHLILATNIARIILLSSGHRVDVDYANQLLAVALHDGEESYVNDVSSPVKAAIGAGPYRELSNRLRQVVYEKFDVPWSYHNEIVKRADLVALAVERHFLMPDSDNWTKVPLEKLPVSELKVLSHTEAEHKYHYLIVDLLSLREVLIRDAA